MRLLRFKGTFGQIEVGAPISSCRQVPKEQSSSGFLGGSLSSTEQASWLLGWDTIDLVGKPKILSTFCQFDSMGVETFRKVRN